MITSPTALLSRLFFSHTFQSLINSGLLESVFGTCIFHCMFYSMWDLQKDREVSSGITSDYCESWCWFMAYGLLQGCWYCDLKLYFETGSCSLIQHSQSSWLESRPQKCPTNYKEQGPLSLCSRICWKSESNSSLNTLIFLALKVCFPSTYYVLAQGSLPQRIYSVMPLSSTVEEE